ncbi:MAG: D-alanyl-D-alanine carboxypeptidase [Alphaproteobacteria bacterium]|nr:D-alanyl-D-alanine carboxypeptidase [Alphaproteobacteria bacterium]
MMFRCFATLLFVLFLVSWAAHVPVSRAEEVFDTNAKAAFLLDMETNQVLFEKNADRLIPPASMSKLMTAYMVLEQLKDGRLRMDDTLPISEKAWKKGGSKMFVEVGKRARVDDLLRGIVVLSGNDACIVVAEGLAGSEENFARDMTLKGKEIGLTGSTFKNASGWPDPGHVMTARDLATLARRLIEDFPDYYDMFAERDFEYSGIRQPNRNLLLGRVRGVDGLKTGHTDEAGYGLVASAIRDERRLISVAVGLDSAQARALENERLLEYGFRRFRSYALMTKGQAIEHASVWLGQEPTVPLVLDQDVKISMTAQARRALKVKLTYETPVPAPVVAGDQLAIIRIEAPGIDIPDVPVFAGGSVAKADFVGRVTGALEYLIFGPS